MNDPQPIATARKNGKAILTNCGIACFTTYHGRKPQWVACDTGGEPFKCADEGYWPCIPTLWVPLPDWMN